jgi:hypothetical protein
MIKPRSHVDWQAVEEAHRAGVLSIRQIGRRHGVSDTAIRKRAAALGWTRAAKAPRDPIVRADSSRGSSHRQRANDPEAMERQYRAGALSLRAIGRQHGVSHCAVLRRAAKGGWTRAKGAQGCTPEVAPAAPIETKVSTESAPKPTAETEAEAVEMAAERRGQAHQPQSLAQRIGDALRARSAELGVGAAREDAATLIGCGLRFVLDVGGDEAALDLLREAETLLIRVILTEAGAQPGRPH